MKYITYHFNFLDWHNIFSSFLSNFKVYQNKKAKFHQSIVLICLVIKLLIVDKGINEILLSCVVSCFTHCGLFLIMILIKAGWLIKWTSKKGKYHKQRSILLSKYGIGSWKQKHVIKSLMAYKYKQPSYV